MTESSLKYASAALGFLADDMAETANIGLQFQRDLEKHADNNDYKAFRQAQINLLLYISGKSRLACSASNAQARAQMEANATHASATAHIIKMFRDADQTLPAVYLDVLQANLRVMWDEQKGLTALSEIHQRAYVAADKEADTAIGYAQGKPLPEDLERRIQANYDRLKEQRPAPNDKG